jgi:hypothetical protein
MTRRLVTLALAALVAFAALPSAWAGSYLDRAALLLDQARKEGDMLQPRMHDKELVDIVRSLAEVRVRVARKMEVPAAITKAHPHLLLVLEASERAASAAKDGNFKKFMEHLNVARDEERIFRAVLSELRYTLPELQTRR